MDSCLTQKIPISMPPWRKYSGVPKIPGYTNVSSLTPILTRFFGSLPESEGQIHSDELFGRIVEFDGGGSCVVETVSKKRKKAFCKVTHLLDPIRTIQTYYADPVKGERRRKEKIENPMNQAYVDGLANYLLGQLRERKLSPHFCQFYGGFQGIAAKYRYNISAEFESYRKYKIFWERKRKGIFGLHVDYDASDDEIDDEDRWLEHTPKSSLRSTPFHYSTPRSARSQSSFESLENIGVEEGKLVELESVHSFKTRQSDSSDSEYDDSDDSDSDDSDDSDTGANIFIELKEHPVMLIFQEEMEGVLDDMLEDFDGEIVGAKFGSCEWEERWIAWTFQVIAALCAAQGALGFTHNDLHTNNIVWKETQESWIFYKARDGTMWRVPTYGKIFCIIDFGRSIFRVNDTWFISDDYQSGGDAEGQYNFDTLLKADKPLVYPNPSFDLCRYAVSIMDALYPDQPAEMLEGNVLSKEGSWEIRETESPFWNLLWSWLLDNNGKNVLREENGDERFPDFDLYQHISKNVHGCKPQEQVYREVFSSFKIPAKDVGDWETVYPLFC